MFKWLANIVLYSFSNFFSSSPFKILPEGSLQLIPGLGRGLLDHVDHRDVVTFTGSAATGKTLKSHPNITENSVPFNLEADSLNACVLGEDAVLGTAEFDLFVKEVHREITVKTGQKCTAVRRILVPDNLIDDVQNALIKRLQKTTIGNPDNKDVRMGALATKIQVERVKENVELLMKSQELVYGDQDNFEVCDADKSKGAFFSPVIFRNDDPFLKEAVHNIEAFGPVSTLIPYKGIDEAVRLVEMGKGSLVTSIVTSDNELAKDFVSSGGKTAFLSKVTLSLIPPLEIMTLSGSINSRKISSAITSLVL